MLKERNFSTMPSLLVSALARNSGILATMLRVEDSFKKYHRPTLSKMTTTYLSHFRSWPSPLETFNISGSAQAHAPPSTDSSSEWLNLFVDGRKESSLIKASTNSSDSELNGLGVLRRGTRGRRRRWWPSDDRPLLQSIHARFPKRHLLSPLHIRCGSSKRQKTRIYGYIWLPTNAYGFTLYYSLCSQFLVSRWPLLPFPSLHAAGFTLFICQFIILNWQPSGPTDQYCRESNHE